MILASVIVNRPFEASPEATKEEAILSSPSTPPGKDPKAERIQAILSAALKEFLEQGFAAARLDSIAERAGIGKGTVYLYFDSKEALFEEAVRSMIVPVIERAETMTFAPQGSAEDLLRGIIQTFYRDVIGTDRRQIIRLLIGEGPRFPRLLAFYHTEVVSRGVKALRKIVNYGIERGEFTTSGAVDYPMLLLAPAMISAIWKMLFDEIEPIDLDKYCQAHLDFILNGLKVAASK